MLYIHTNHQLERLSQQFSAVVNTPLKQVFSPEIVVVQNAGIARYLSMQHATIGGISANTEYLFPAEFMWRLLRLISPDIPEKSECTPDTLRFHFMQELCEQPSDYPELSHYIYNHSKEDIDEMLVWDLSCQLAEMFDKILFYRSHWVKKWEDAPQQESSNNWQARLWIRCVKDKNLQHWLHLQEQFKNNITNFNAQLLPERISFFSMSSLSPGYLELLGEIAQQVDIHVYIINPCNDIYWGDIASEKSRAKLSLEKQAYIDTGNPLLASMGAQGRDFIDQLLSLTDSSDSCEHNPIPTFENTNPEDIPSSLLHTIQQDIYTLSEPKALDPRENAPKLDKSLSFNACHTVMREVEVLHDQILDALDSDPSLSPSDIVVMMPDVEKYAPYIESLFSSQIYRNSSNSTHLPFSIADRDPLNVHQLIEALLKIFSLPETHYDVESVFEILDYEAIRTSFNLDEEQVNHCRQLARASNIRWGIDKTSRVQNNFPNTSEHTWKAALDRILLGYSLGEENDHHPLFTNKDENILPFTQIEGSDAVMLANLKNFTDILFRTNQWNDQKYSLTKWLDKVAKFIVLLFSDKNGTSLNELSTINNKDLTLILESIDELRDLGKLSNFNSKFSFAILKKILQAALQKISGHEKFLGHGITFCALVPMRSVPFKLVALLGMNDGEFPRQDKYHSFDKLSKEPRRGDRSRRDEDRYLFLESILAARQRLIISFIGQSIKDNTDIPPSTLVGELLDTLCIYTGTKHEDHICKHPLQAFSARYFVQQDSTNKSQLLFSYAKEYAELEKQKVNDTPPKFIHKKLSILDDSYRTISLDDLIQFFQSPAQTFLGKRFDIKTFEENITLPIREPFKLESFKDKELREIIYHHDFKNDEYALSTISEMNQQIARAKGILPYGDIGESVYKKEEAIIQQFHAEYPIPNTLESKTVSIKLGDFTLHGKINHQTSINTRVIQKLTKPYAREMIELWLNHLFFNTQTKGSTEFYSPEESFILNPVENATAQLESLLQYLWNGLHFPLYFFPKSAYDMYKETGQAKLFKARKTWNGSDRISGEKEKFENNLLYQNVFLEEDTKPTDEFLAISEHFFGEMAIHKGEVSK